jgi:hypothetical protein
MADRKICFVGYTDAEEEIVLYVEDPADETDYVFLHNHDVRNPIYRRDFFLKLPNGEVWALSPESTITVWDDLTESQELTHIMIKSPEWTGTAKGTRKDLMRAELAEKGGL